VLCLKWNSLRFPRAWPQPPQANRLLVTKPLPHDVALLGFVPIIAPAGSSPHASVASLSMQKAFAIPAGVYVNSTSKD